MKKRLSGTSQFFESLTRSIGSIGFITAPSLYIIYTYGISYHGHHALSTVIGIMVSFLLFVFVHIKFFRKHYYADKLRVQVIITNLTVEAFMFSIALDNTKEGHVSSFGALVAIVCAIVIAIVITLLQIHDNGSIKKAFSGKIMYQSLIAITMALFTVFFVYQIYVFWATLYIFVPVVTGSIMLSTIYKNGIAHENSESPLNLFATIPFMFLIGLISIISQYFNTIILGSPLWKLLLLILLVTVALMYVIYSPKYDKEQAEIDKKNYAD